MINREYFLDTITTFLNQFPDLYNPISKNDFTDPKNEIGKKFIRNRIEKSLDKLIIPSFPKTVPDPLVSVILENYYDINNQRLKQVQYEHQISMAAENKVGEYLELYISSIANQNMSWVNCIDGIVKGIDFIKKKENSWNMLQVKNRSNSENSSSSKIRILMKQNHNIEIQKWHRVDANTGLTKWNFFPDEFLKNQLNEADFYSFIKNYLSNIKKIETKEKLI